MQNLMKKTVVVTGGTRGIGAGVSQVLSASGWHVIAASNSQAEIDSFDRSENTEACLLDVTNDASVKALFDNLEQLDGLVNCAGILQRGAEYDIAVFQRVIDVNLTGTMRCCVAAQPLLAQSKGAIVNTASMLSTFGGPLVPAYSASKGGVAQLTKALAGQWADDGIRVNAVAPGWIETEMTQGLRDAPERSNAILSRTPMKRWGKTEEDQLPFPKDAQTEIVIPNAIPEDERIWVPQTDTVSFRPLCLNRSQGYWMNLLKVTQSGVLSRHRHPQPVHGWVLKGTWHYLEHDWVAEPGSYVYEPPGETHTLVVPEGVDEMITYFQVNGVMCYVDPWGEVLGYEDVFSKIELCRKHYAAVGLGEDYVDQFIR